MSKKKESKPIKEEESTIPEGFEEISEIEKETIPEKEKKQEDQQEKKEEEQEKEPKKETLTLNEEERSFQIIEGKKYSKELLEKARFAGWRDKEFLDKMGKGNIYMDPETYLARGEISVPFLNKKIDKLEKKNERLVKMLQKQIKGQISDKITDIDGKLKEAKEYGEYENMETMLNKKLQLKEELKQYEQIKEDVQKQQANLSQRPLEIIQWELRNPWIFDSSQENIIKKTKANELLIRLNNVYPQMPLKDKLEYIDNELQKDIAINVQKKNMHPPATQSKGNTATHPVSRKVANLRSSIKKQFFECCKDARGKKFTGKTLKTYTQTFLNSCSDEDFI